MERRKKCSLLVKKNSAAWEKAQVKEKMGASGVRSVGSGVRGQGGLYLGRVQVGAQSISGAG